MIISGKDIAFKDFYFFSIHQKALDVTMLIFSDVNPIHSFEKETSFDYNRMPFLWNANIAFCNFLNITISHIQIFVSRKRKQLTSKYPHLFGKKTKLTETVCPSLWTRARLRASNTWTLLLDLVTIGCLQPDVSYASFLNCLCWLFFTEKCGQYLSCCSSYRRHGPRAVIQSLGLRELQLASG